MTPLLRLVGIFAVAVMSVPFAGGHALAQPTGTDLSQFVVDPSVLGDGWSLASQESDNLFRGFSPAAVEGYSFDYKQSAQISAGISLYSFASHADALASLSDPYFYWGHGNTRLVPLTGLGDDQSFRAYGVGKGPNSGITFVDGPVVVYVRAEDDTALEASGVDAICDALAAAEDSLLQGPPASATTAAADVGEALFGNAAN